MIVHMDRDKMRSLSEVMVPSTFNKIIRKNDLSSISRIIKSSSNIQENTTNLDLINVIYDELIRNYKNEYVYKNILTKKILLKHSLRTTVALSELAINNSIADFVLLNGKAKVYEIKTEFDHLGKLEKQLLDYCKFADEVYIVSHTKHIQKIREMYENSNIGIIELTQRNALNTIQKARNNNETFDYRVLFNLLRKPEYLALVNNYFGYIPNVPNTRIFQKCLELIKTIDILDFQKMVVKQLKGRNIKNPKKIKDKSVPDNLKHVCYCLDFSLAEYEKLEDFLNQRSQACISHI
ncbi:MAG: sce7726 family protein [Alcaligenaceae bacterium]|nr:sce7726 family protein [Alcaligenaceae bacterium]